MYANCINTQDYSTIRYFSSILWLPLYCHWLFELTKKTSSDKLLYKVHLLHWKPARRTQNPQMNKRNGFEDYFIVKTSGFQTKYLIRVRLLGQSQTKVNQNQYQLEVIACDYSRHWNENRLIWTLIYVSVEIHCMCCVKKIIVLHISFYVR